MGHERPSEVSPSDVMKRVQSTGSVLSFAELYPRPTTGALLAGAAAPPLQAVWDRATHHYRSPALPPLVSDIGHVPITASGVNVSVSVSSNLQSA